MPVLRASEPSHYEVLNLPVPTPSTNGNVGNISRDELKKAYHRALLFHHPDKAGRSHSGLSQARPDGLARGAAHSAAHEIDITNAVGGRRGKGSPDSSSEDGRNGKGKSKNSPCHGKAYSIDQIVNAYTVLSDAQTRQEYDATLLQQTILNGQGYTEDGTRTSMQNKGSHAGVEVFDLDELDYNEESTTRSSHWSRDCRCGNAEGYVVTEDELERESRYGEIYVGCRGCSLFIRVLFAVEGG